MANIPLFIPHAGCKNSCSFCNQNSITGKAQAPKVEECDKIISEHLQTLTKKPMIAFFGGSFTGIEKSMMESYLKTAYKYVEKGQVEGIRLSTRPDYISEEILHILKSYRVTNIELGAQSMDDEVLKMANRGHDSACVRKASEMILEKGFTLGLQMMIGLQGDSREKSLATAREFISLGARETRLYPTVVLGNTLLEKRYLDGSYKPFSFDEAVDITARCYSIFFENGVKVLRIGLPASENLKESVVAGFYHEAMGEMVLSRVIRQAAEKEKGAVISYNGRCLSKVLGQKKENIGYFEENGIDYTLVRDDTLSGVCVNSKYVLTI